MLILWLIFIRVTDSVYGGLVKLGQSVLMGTEKRANDKKYEEE